MELEKSKYKPAEEKLKDLLSESQPGTVEKVSCPSCGTAVPAGNMNLDRAVAKCDGCDGVFSIADTLHTVTTHAAATIAEPIPVINNIPDGIEYATFSDGLDFRCQLEHAAGWSTFWVLLCFALLCLAFNVFIFMSTTPVWIQGLAGLFTLGSFIAAFDSYTKKTKPTHVFVNQRELVIEYAGNEKDFVLDVDRVEKIWVEQDYFTNMNTGEKYKVYNMYIKDTNGLDNKVFKNIRAENQLRFMVQEINKYLAKA